MSFSFKTFCLTLPENPERRSKAEANFKELGIDVTFCDGIHGATAGVYTIHPYEVDNPGSGFRMGFAPTGIFLAHYMLWTALQFLEGDHFFILEDDVKFAPDWSERTEKSLSDVPPDFDMLYLGSCCCKIRFKRHIKGEVWEVRYPQCTHAYMVAKKALPVMLATNRRIYAPVDIALTLHTHPRLKIATVLPRIFEQVDCNIPE